MSDPVEQAIEKAAWDILQLGSHVGSFGSRRELATAIIRKVFKLDRMGRQLSDPDLESIRSWLAENSCHWTATDKDCGGFASRMNALLAHIDFLQQIVSDLTSPEGDAPGSAAYQRGVEEGVRQEKERIAQIAKDAYAIRYPNQGMPKSVTIKTGPGQQITLHELSEEH